MRSVAALCACLLTACSTQAVRCERHLTPINVPERPNADLAPSHSKEASAQVLGATESHDTRRMTVGRQAREAKRPTLAAGGEGTP